jgi:hypothetical protein
MGRLVLAGDAHLEGHFHLTEQHQGGVLVDHLGHDAEAVLGVDDGVTLLEGVPGVVDGALGGPHALGELAPAGGELVGAVGHLHVLGGALLRGALLLAATHDALHDALAAVFLVHGGGELLGVAAGAAGHLNHLVVHHGRHGAVKIQAALGAGNFDHIANLGFGIIVVHLEKPLP